MSDERRGYEPTGAWERRMFLGALRYCVEHGVEIPGSTPSMRRGLLKQYGIEPDAALDATPGPAPVSEGEPTHVLDLRVWLESEIATLTERFSDDRSIYRDLIGSRLIAFGDVRDQLDAIAARNAGQEDGRWMSDERREAAVWRVLNRRYPRLTREDMHDLFDLGMEIAAATPGPEPVSDGEQSDDAILASMRAAERRCTATMALTDGGPVSEAEVHAACVQFNTHPSALWPEKMRSVLESFLAARHAPTPD